MTGLGLQFRLLQRPLLSFHPETPGHRNRFRQSQNLVDELGGEAIVKLNSQSPLRSRPKPWRKPRMSLAGLCSETRKSCIESWMYNRLADDRPKASQSVPGHR